MSIEDVLNKIESDILRDGVSIIGVMGSEDTPSFVYTVGLSETFKHPEIISIGLPAKVFHGILSIIIDEYLSKGEVLSTSATYDKLANLPIAFINVSKFKKEEYMYMLDNYYGESSDDISAIQLLWTDKEGHFPFEAEFDEQMESIQPMLGVRRL